MTRTEATTGYCCSRMAAEMSLDCDKHSPRRACPDVIVDRNDDGMYGLVIHDGGSALVQIIFCPWCGTSLSRAAHSQPGSDA